MYSSSKQWLKPARHFIAAVLLTLFTGEVFAQEDIRVKNMVYTGQGCPRGSIGYVFDPIQNILTVNFDDFAARLMGRGGRRTNQCHFTLVMETRPGISIGLERAQYLGYISTEPTVSSELWRKYTLSGVPTINRTTNFDRGYNDDFTVTDQLGIARECKRNVTINLQTRVSLRGQPSGSGYNEIVIDTSQYQGRFLFYFTTGRC